MKEVRHAVLVGMNNYKENKLSYSVKDVEDVKNVLISNCRFEEKNVRTVTNSETPVINQIATAFESVRKNFQPGADLLLFYYSGHGEYDDEEEKSLLFFEDETSMGIVDVLLQYFQLLKAKNHYLIIDACHSGKNVYVKPKHNIRKIERKLLNDSKELYFLFAAEENKKAYQDERLKNSYYTYYFVEAIRNKKLYDDDGLLTMNSIDEYVRKKISSHNNLVQIPGSESRTTGYKPFAFLKENKEEAIMNKPVKVDIVKGDTEVFDLEQSISSQNRQEIHELLKGALQNVVEGFEMKELDSVYEINIASGYGEMPYNVEQEVEKGIIKEAQRSNLMAINNLFVMKEIKQNISKTGLSAVFDMLHGEPEKEYSYDITYNDYYIIPAYIKLKAKSFEKVSGGLYCMFYQAKYGFVFCKAFFRYKWDGTHEVISNYVKVELVPYKLTINSVDKAKADLSVTIQELLDSLKKWNVERRSEIDAFLKIAK